MVGVQGVGEEDGGDDHPRQRDEEKWDPPDTLGNRYGLMISIGSGAESRRAQQRTHIDQDHRRNRHH